MQALHGASASFSQLPTQSHWRDNAEGKFAEVLVARCTLIPFATQKRLNIEGVTDHGPGWHQGSAVQGSAETDAKLLSQMVVRWQQRKYLREKSGPRALKHDYYHARLYASCERSTASPIDLDRSQDA